MKKVGIEGNLGNVKRYLERKDCTVEVLDEKNKESRRALNSFDAVVVSGADSNLMGMQDVLTNTRVISAQGKTEDEIYNEIVNANNLKKR